MTKHNSKKQRGGADPENIAKPTSTGTSWKMLDLFSSSNEQNKQINENPLATNDNASTKKWWEVWKGGKKSKKSKKSKHTKKSKKSKTQKRH
jgi:hypothetical protein